MSRDAAKPRQAQARCCTFLGTAACICQQQPTQAAPPLPQQREGVCPRPRIDMFHYPGPNHAKQGVLTAFWIVCYGRNVTRPALK